MPLRSWTRLEAVPRDVTLAEGVQARIADPLWLLARQAAFGEFSGEDSGSPVFSRIRARVNTFTRFRPGSPAQANAVVPLDSNALPVEVLIESEPYVDGGIGLLDAAQAGQHYLRMLGGAAGVGDLTTYRQGLLRAYPVNAPGDPRVRAYAGRVPHGGLLYAALRDSSFLTNGTLPASPSLGAATASVVTTVALAWCRWYESLFVHTVGPQSAWRADRLEYSASISSPGPGTETVLRTSEYGAGNLDWFDFDVQPAGTSLGASGADTQVLVAAVAAPAAFRGMPLPRLWSFEDAAVNFGAVAAPVEDATTSLMVEFALRYGNDHFIMPFPLAIGSLCHIDSLVVVNTFGETILVPSVVDVDGVQGPFRLFEHRVELPGATPAPRSSVFVLFPTLDHVISATPLEEVHYLRDELADLVWAVERIALGANGLPVDRGQIEAARRAAPTLPSSVPLEYLEGPAEGRVSYRLRTDVPGNWFPLLPPETGPVSALTPATVPPLDGSPAPQPWTRILAEQSGGLAPEEVTRVGVQASRMWRYARWIDGRHVAWIARGAGPGRGPGSSGLRFDVLQPFQRPGPPPPSPVPPMAVSTRSTVGQDTVLRRLND